MYKYKTLNASGLYYEVENININHKPHMSLFYNHNNTIEYYPPQELWCKLYIANTTNIDYTQWTAQNSSSIVKIDSSSV